MRHAALKVQFDSLEQQHEASRLGLWLFLATEYLFFGGLFLAFSVYHLLYPQAFAEAGKHTNLLCGSLNAGILLTSGLTMSLGVAAIRRGAPNISAAWIGLTILLAFAFLAVKGAEYADDIHKHLVPGASFALPHVPAAQIFFYLYWLMTAVHALHVIVGVGFMLIVLLLIKRGRFSPQYYSPVEFAGIYWGFVDVIWIFLYPLLYLLDRHT